MGSLFVFIKESKITLIRFKSLKTKLKCTVVKTMIQMKMNKKSTDTFIDLECLSL